MGGRCAHFSNYMGPWCLTNSDYIGGGVRPISNSVGGCIAFAASRRGKNISANRPVVPFLFSVTPCLFVN